MPWSENQRARLTALVQHDNLRYRKMSFGQYRALEWGHVLVELPQYYEWAAKEADPGVMMQAWCQWCARYVTVDRLNHSLEVRDTPVAFAEAAEEPAAEPTPPATDEPQQPTSALDARAVDLIAELTGIIAALQLRAHP